MDITLFIVSIAIGFMFPKPILEFTENEAGKIRFAKLSFYRVLPTSIYSQEMRKKHKNYPFLPKEAASLLRRGEEKIFFITCLIVD